MKILNIKHCLLFFWCHGSKENINSLMWTCAMSKCELCSGAALGMLGWWGEEGGRGGRGSLVLTTSIMSSAPFVVASFILAGGDWSSAAPRVMRAEAGGLSRALLSGLLRPSPANIITIWQCTPTYDKWAPKTWRTRSQHIRAHLAWVRVDIEGCAVASMARVAPACLPARVSATAKLQRPVCRTQERDRRRRRGLWRPAPHWSPRGLMRISRTATAARDLHGDIGDTLRLSAVTSRPKGAGHAIAIFVTTTEKLLVHPLLLSTTSNSID